MKMSSKLKLKNKSFNKLYTIPLKYIKNPLSTEMGRQKLEVEHYNDPITWKLIKIAIIITTYKNCESDIVNDDIPEVF